MTVFLCFNKTLTTYYDKKHILIFDTKMLKRVLNIAVPNGVEQGIFQLVKVALSSVVALFGTYQIAANGVAQSIWSLAALVGVTMGPVFITVIGQCMGAEDIDSAHYYFKKLMKITVIFSIIWNVFILAITPLFLQYYQLSSETKNLVFILVIIHNLFNTIAFPFSGPLSNGLRATGDVKYTMIVSILSTVVVRGILSIIFGITFNLGVIGIALAMCADWSMRAIVFHLRYKSDKWTQFSVIE